MHDQQRGFSLIELMMALVILGILAAVAYPSYQDSLTKGRRADGQGKLLELMNAQERFFTENGTYTTTLSTFAAVDGDGKVASDEGFYKVSAAACSGATIATCVILTAAPQAAQSADGNLTYNSRGQKTPTDKW